MNLGLKSKQVMHRARVHFDGANDDIPYLPQETAQVLLPVVPIGGTGELIVEDGPMSANNRGDID
jgi:hypothetical protein